LITTAAGNLKDMQQNSKDIYRSNVFDRLRDGKGPLSVYNKSKSDIVPLKTQKDTKRPEETRAVFTKETPSQIFSPIIQKINTRISWWVVLI
jgi:mannose-6-phosphate isomerase class I